MWSGQSIVYYGADRSVNQFLTVHRLLLSEVAVAMLQQ
jgi:hypothetical protein